jgi:hypothetical protein
MGSFGRRLILGFFLRAAELGEITGRIEIRRQLLLSRRQRPKCIQRGHAFRRHIAGVPIVEIRR